MPMTTWISHRGITQQYSENTGGAFDAAIAGGFTELETDLRMCGDGHAVLCHDRSLTRLGQANFKTLQIERATRAELTRARLACGEPLLFFDELLERYPKQRWILDIKPQTDTAVVRALLALHRNPAHAEFLSNRCRYLFWRPSPQKLLEQHLPKAQCLARLYQCRRAALASLSRLPALAGIVPGKTYALPPALHGRRLITAQRVQQYRQRGAQVLGYLPKTPEEIRWALAAGVDEILTDHPLHLAAKRPLTD